MKHQDRFLNRMPERVRSIFQNILQDNLTGEELTALALLITLEAQHQCEQARKPRLILIEGGKPAEEHATDD